MKKYHVSWTEFKPVYHEVEVEAEDQNSAARLVQIGDHGEKTIIDVKSVKPEGDWER